MKPQVTVNYRNRLEVWKAFSCDITYFNLLLDLEHIFHKIFTNPHGGVHICKLSYGDLPWENSSNPESYALWYIIIIGHYT